MCWITKIRAWTSLWIGEVATAILVWRDALLPPRLARLVEQEDGSLAMQEPAAVAAPKRGLRSKPASEPPRKPFRITDGAVAPDDAALLGPYFAHAKVEIMLRPEGFLFRPLQLPRRAGDFLEAIIRAQIDRLTPWSPAEAAFGFWADPHSASDRMTVVVAATARARLRLFVDALRALGAESISISTLSPDDCPEAIKVFEQRTSGASEAKLLRRGLAAVLAGLAFLAVASILVSSFVGGDLETRQGEIDRRIAQRRADMRHGTDPNSSAALALRQKKRDTPATVIVYEELSRILPDDAYLTELHIQGDKAQIVGVARDAPDLIRLIEQSPHFTAATFYAPTTRTRTDSGQHFFIETHVRAVFPAAGASDP